MSARWFPRAHCKHMACGHWECVPRVTARAHRDRCSGDIRNVCGGSMLEAIGGHYKCFTDVTMPHSAVHIGETL